MIYASCNLVTQKKEAGVYGYQTLPENIEVTGYKTLKIANFDLFSIPKNHTFKIALKPYK